jgi:hypothetical protein
MISKKTWGIIGLGWLGQALADQLKTLDIKVWGTRTENPTANPNEILTEAFVFGQNDFPSQTCDVLFINTPPILDLTPTDFVGEIHTPENRDDFKLIFISSTSVYGPRQKHCTEDTQPEPWTANGKWLYEVEKLLQEKYQNKVLILRPGGLIGGERHPVFYFSKSQQVSGGVDPVNLIHRQDLIQIILQAEALNMSGVINAVAPFHPSKSDYYNGWSKKLKLNSINFSLDVQSLKTVDSVKLPLFYKSWQCERLDHI